MSPKAFTMPSSEQHTAFKGPSPIARCDAAKGPSNPSTKRFPRDCGLCSSAGSPSMKQRRHVRNAMSLSWSSQWKSRTEPERSQWDTLKILHSQHPISSAKDMRKTLTGLHGHQTSQVMAADATCNPLQPTPTMRQGSVGCRRGANRQLSEKSRVDRSSHWCVAPLQSHSWDPMGHGHWNESYVYPKLWGNSISPCTPFFAAKLQIVQARHCDDRIPRQLTFLNHLLLIVFPLSPFPASIAVSPVVKPLPLSNRNWNTLKCQPEPTRITIWNSQKVAQAEGQNVCFLKTVVCPTSF